MPVIDASLLRGVTPCDRIASRATIATVFSVELINIGATFVQTRFNLVP
jgi:hypothetical protein